MKKSKNRSVVGKTLKSYEVWILDSKYRTIVNDYSLPRARYKYYLDVFDIIPNLKITDMRGRILGGPQLTKALDHTINYTKRQISAGTKIKTIAGDDAVIVDSCGHYFEIIMTKSGCRVPIHHNEIIPIADPLKVLLRKSKCQHSKTTPSSSPFHKFTNRQIAELHFSEHFESLI